MISETKIEEIFALDQFKIGSFNTLFCFDCHSSSGVAFLCVSEDIPAKLIGCGEPSIKDFYVEMNLRNQNCLISCSFIKTNLSKINIWEFDLRLRLKHRFASSTY